VDARLLRRHGGEGTGRQSGRECKGQSLSHGREC
jgi:hypothetical protein